MRVAKVYNSVVGTSLTHFDVLEWGFKDDILILNAITYLSHVEGV